MNTLQIILTSGVISAIITGVLNSLSNQKSGRLNYILGEKKTWRNSIKNIVANLNRIEHSYPKDDESCNILLSSIKENITNLEIRLNTFEIIEDPKKISVEHLIWKNIDLIYKINDFKSLIDSGELTKLRRNISLLLKMDWERSKFEFFGDLIARKLHLLFSVLIFTILLIGYQFRKMIFSNHIVFMNVLLSIFISTCILYIILYNWNKIYYINKYICIILIPFSIFIFTIYFFIKNVFNYKDNNKLLFDKLYENDHVNFSICILLIIILMILALLVFNIIIELIFLNSERLEPKYKETVKRLNNN